MTALSSLPEERRPAPSLRGGTGRKILRWTHVVLTIPVLGFIYGQPADVQQYGPAVRFLFVPIIMLSGFWMYAGVLFAVLAVAVWLGAYRLFGSGAAILIEAGFIAAWRIGAVRRARR